jgi:DNA-binding transcriptional regulator YdaS (Cro superfamily)
MKNVAEIIEQGGGCTQVARKLNLPLQTVHSWGLRNKVPAERVLEIERATGVPRHDIRPDIYPLSERLERRIECLLAMGMTREAAEKIVKETAGPA